jgi:hypothetical protein
MGEEYDPGEIMPDVNFTRRENRSMTNKPINPVDTVILQQLQTMGFSDDIDETPRRLIVSSTGQPKTGKSAWALTATDPIIYFDIDLGTEGVVGKFQQAGKKVYLYHIRVPKQKPQDFYLPMWKDLRTRVEKVYTLRKGTVVFDTTSETYELCRLARFGKLTQVQPHNYTEVNNEWRDFLRLAYDSPMNTIFIHKVKPVWVNVTDANGRLKSSKTNEFELAGFGEMNYAVQVNIIHRRKDTEEGTVFSIEIEDCRQTAGLAGMVIEGMPLPRGENRVGDPLCNFDMLLDLVHGPAPE